MNNETKTPLMHRPIKISSFRSRFEDFVADLPWIALAMFFVMASFTRGTFFDGTQAEIDSHGLKFTALVWIAMAIWSKMHKFNR